MIKETSSKRKRDRLTFDLRLLLIIDCWYFSSLLSPWSATTGPRHWELLQRSRATDNQLYVCACSPARPSEKEIQEKKSYPSWGHSTVVNPWSEVVATTDEKEGIVNWKLEKSQIEEVRKMIPIGTQRRWDVYRDVGRVWERPKGSVSVVDRFTNSIWTIEVCLCSDSGLGGEKDVVCGCQETTHKGRISLSLNFSS